MKKILFIHQEKKFKYGAHYINDLIIDKLRCSGNTVDTIYPKESINILSGSLSGINNILFFYSLIGMKKNILKKYDIIQGTTYTILPFLDSKVHLISHFGSTTSGFLRKVPHAKRLYYEKSELIEIYNELKSDLSLHNNSASIRSSLKDIHKIEIAVAKKSTAVIATSENVKKELIRNKVPKSKIHIIHNAIEDYWFKSCKRYPVKNKAVLVYLGRIGEDLFTLKLKGINRLVYVLRQFKSLNKRVIIMTSRLAGYTKVFSKIPRCDLRLSMEKKEIPPLLSENYGDIYINTGRYEGFCLSLIEAMSQGLVPIIFPIGVAPEIIKNGKNGYLVHNIDEMIDRINLLTFNRKKRALMAKESIKTSMQFKSEILIKNLTKLYSEL